MGMRRQENSFIPSIITIFSTKKFWVQFLTSLSGTRNQKSFSTFLNFLIHNGVEVFCLLQNQTVKIGFYKLNSKLIYFICGCEKQTVEKTYTKKSV